jgi:hypothetical protein
MTRSISTAVIAIAVLTMAVPVVGAEPEALSTAQFQERLRGLSAESGQAERLSRAVDLATHHSLSSAQVKALAAGLGDDAARLEFAIAAYPHTVDPENFYDVYDAFTSLSKVMRLHDWIRAKGQPSASTVVVVPMAVSEAEMRDIVQALKKESFDQSRSKLGQQILSSSRRKFLAAQVRDMIKCFDFDVNRLEFAKFAYDYTLDRERYFVVNEAFDFSSNGQALSQYIQTKNRSAKPERR